MNNNGRYSMNIQTDSDFHIKVNRNLKPYKNTINQFSSNKHIEVKNINNYYSDKKINKKKDDFLFKKNKTNKNKLQYLNNANNQKLKTEKGIIDTLHSIKNNFRKLYNSNKINKSNSNYSFGNNNINYNTIINDYRTKLKINKNKLNNNNLIKASSLNNNLKKSIKNLGINCYNLKSNKKNNNILIDDTTSNDTDVLTESGNNNKETNLYVYRSEVHYPVKNIISNFNLPKNPYNSNYNYCNSTLNADIDKYKTNEFLDSTKKLVENLSKSVGNSLSKKKIYYKTDSKNNYKNIFLSPLQTRILSNIKNNKKNINNSSNNSIKFKNNFQKETFSPKLLNFLNEKKNKDKINNIYIDKINNQNAKSCQHFYQKKNSKDKYDKIFNKDSLDEKSSNNERTIYLNTRQNRINNIFLSNENIYDITNYNYYNRKEELNNQLKSISLLCNSIEKYLISVIKYHFVYFMNQLKEYIEYKKKNTYESENKKKDINIHSLLLKRIKNKINSKKLYMKDRTYLSTYFKHNNYDNKLNSFNIISRNDNPTHILKKKSNSINKSLNMFLNNNKDEIIYINNKKRKNLSFNKIYIPIHNNPRYSKYKTLKINTNSFTKELNLNINNDDINNTINNTLNTINIYTHTHNNQNNLHNSDLCNSINKNVNIIKNHITALKRKFIKKNMKNLTFSSDNFINNKNEEDYTIKNVQKTSNNVYSKPIFKKIKNKLEKNNFNSARKNLNIENKLDEYNNIFLDNLKKEKNENKIYYSDKKNNYNSNIKNYLMSKKIIKKIKKIKEYNLNNKQIINKKDNNNNNENDLNNIKSITKDNNLNDINNNTENKGITEIEINNNDNNIIKSIIVKDVRSRDKKLNVFIKYYECNFHNFSNKNKFNYSLSIISNDIITILSTTNNGNSQKNKNNNKYFQQFLSSIIEEDERSKANPSLNNSNSVISEDDNEKHKINKNNKKILNNNNSFTNNLVIYLTNILQNLFDDNKKMILYLFMRNLKKIQNKLYLKDSLFKYNSMINQGAKEPSVSNNSITNNENKNITSNGANEVELNNNQIERNHSNKNIYFYTPDNSLLDGRINNQKNFLIGSLLFKDFEIKEDEYNFIKPKKSLSSSSISQIKDNGSDKNIFYNKKIFKDIIIDINKKKIINYYFKYWKQFININNNNHIINKKCDNGMNSEDRKKGAKNINNKINGINIDNYNEVIFLDNGIDAKYEEMKNKNIGINKEILSNKKDTIERNINKYRNSLIKFMFKK